MNTYESMINRILKIADYVKNNKLAPDGIPFAKIMEAVQSAYDIRPGNGQFFVGLYGQLIIKGLENRDNDQIAAVLTLLAKHIEILYHDEKQINRQTRDMIDRMNEKRHLQCRMAHLLNCEKVRRWHEENTRETEIPFCGKGVVYSAITGDYDQVREPKYINPGLDYILFTNNPQITSSVWQVRMVENKEQLDNVRLARRIKILGHEYLPEYDYSIWVDGKLEIESDLGEYVEKYRKKEPVLCFTHYENNDIYQEKETCITLRKDNPEIVEKQVRRYHEEGYPADSGLVESGVMVRELHDERVRRIMQIWWEEIITGSRRDQLSFNYACWKENFVYDTTDLYIYENKYVNVYDHN